MERTTFWSRVGDWIRNPRRSMGWDLDESAPTQFAKVQPDPYQAANGGTADDSSNGEKRAWLPFGNSRRNFEDQSRQLTDLIKSLQAQSQRQTAAAESSGASLERLAAHLGQLPAALQAQHAEIAALRKQVDQFPGGQKHVQEIVSHLSGIRETVREGAAAFNRQSELTIKSSETIATELQRQGQAVTQLAQSTDPMMRAILALRADIGTKGEELNQCVAALNRKLIQFAIAALILAGIAAIIGIVAMIR